MGWSSKAVIAAAVLAVVLVAAVPVAFFAGVIMMLLGHVIGGLALFGASVLVAVVAVTVASLTGVRHVRKLVGRTIADLQGRVGEPGFGDPSDQDSQHGHPVVTLDRSDYE
jgi:low affinity Fe/Cu permease